MTTTKPRHRLRSDAPWPMTAEEFAAAGMEYAGIPLADLTPALTFGTAEAVYGAHGHINPALMAEAVTQAEEAGLLIGSPDHPGTVTPGDVEHTWAVMEPSWPGAPDDEWCVNWADPITWATPGAFPLTIVRRPA